MKTRKWSALTMAALTALCVWSCQDWGEMDPPAGRDVYPILENVATYGFNEELDPALIQPFAYSGGDTPQIIDDAELGKVLQLDSGYARVANPLKSVKVQNSVSITFWMKQPTRINAETEEALPQDLEGAILGFQNENNTQRMFFTANGWISYDGVDGEYEDNNPSGYATGYMPEGTWHYVALCVKDNGYLLYVDGKQKVNKPVANFDFNKIVQFMASAQWIYFGYGSDAETKSLLIDDVKIYRNSITDKEIQMPKTEGGSSSTPVPDPVYFNNFERGLEGASIVGAGKIENIGGNWGNVFQNATGGLRQNYLLLPKDILMPTGSTKQMTISVWVNASNAGASGSYMWSPLFTAYGSAPTGGTNGTPMLACQYRGVVMVNTNGSDNQGTNWCDYTDAQNDAGANVAYHDATDWLADHEWHLYTAVFTETTAAVYLDGELANSWTISGSGEGNTCAIFGQEALNYICLGGNQAWNWGDPDPGFMFDDFAIYNQALSADQVKTIVESRKDLPSPIYWNNFEYNLHEATIVGDGKVEAAGDLWGNVFQNAAGGLRQNYLLLPADALMKSGETQELTISVWANASNAGASGSYMWSPIFTAYGAAPAGGTNGSPMLACQYRGVVMTNTNGSDNQGTSWCDYTDAQNDAGANVAYHDATDWLADHEWHLYTAVFTKTTAAVYLDGELANSWTITGSGEGNTCAIFGNQALSYICLGGNQAWNWGDPDPGFMFDGLNIYNKAFTQDQVKKLVQQKKQ